MARSGSYTLSDFQIAGHASVEIACSVCERRGVYNLARLLAVRVDLRMTDYLTEVTANCPRRQGVSIYSRCEAFYPVLSRAKR